MVRLCGLVAFAAGELAVFGACDGSGEAGSNNSGHVKVLNSLPNLLKNLLLLGLAAPTNSSPSRDFPPQSGPATAITSPQFLGVDSPNELSTDAPCRGSCRRLRRKEGFPLSLANKFKGAQYIGEGVHSRVFSATYRDRKVAVKLPILNDNASEPLDRRTVLVKLLREFQIGHSMKHEGGPGNKGSDYIMDSIETNIDEEGIMQPEVQPYMAVEFCGTNLVEFLSRRQADNSVGEALLLDIYTQVLQALAYLRRHPCRWVHHDLTLDNIGILEIDGKVHVRLLDYGCAVMGLPGHERDPTAARRGYAPPAWSIQTTFAFELDDAPMEDEEQFSRVATSFDVFYFHVSFLEMLGFSDQEAAETAQSPPQTQKDIDIKVDEVVTRMVELGYVDHNHHCGIRDVIANAMHCFHVVPEFRPSAEELLKFMEARGKPDLK